MPNSYGVLNDSYCWDSTVTLMSANGLTPSDKGGMSVSAAGRKGGVQTRDKYGAHHFSEIGEKGGTATLAKYGPSYYSQIGKKGGKSRAEKKRGGS